jgi:hypothetical protein
MKFSTKSKGFVILSSSSMSKTALFSQNWTTIPFFSGNLQVII